MAYIGRLAAHVPAGILGNELFARYLATSPDWIVDRTGIRERRYLADYDGDVPSFELARRAARALFAQDGAAASRVGMIMSAAAHDDMAYPNMADRIAGELGLAVPAVHVKAGCSSVGYAIALAGRMVPALGGDVLIANGEAFTRHVDYGDRKSAILFGDAGSALTVSREPGAYQIVDVEIGGSSQPLISADRRSDTAHWSVWDFVANEKPARTTAFAIAEPKFQQDGRAVVDFVLANIPAKASAFLARHGLTAADVDVFVSHQANLALMRQLCARLGVRDGAHRYNVDRNGNTSSAGWVTVLAEETPAIAKGATVFVATFGAGMNWSLLLLRRC